MKSRTRRLFTTTTRDIEAYVDKISRNSVNAMISSTPADVIRQELSKPSSGALSGVTVAVKDNFCTKDHLTTCGSKLLSRSFVISLAFVPTYDATVVELLKSAGAVIIGKTNLDEFGMGSENTNSYFGPVLNPLDSRRVSGGSSGGSAAAVASGLCEMYVPLASTNVDIYGSRALGSDTGGSVRLPAAYCGVYGFKPSYGLISRFGLVSYASSLDTVGILSNSVEHIRTTFGRNLNRQALSYSLGVLNVHDSRDPMSLAAEPRRLLAAQQNKFTTLRDNLKGLRIGLPKEYLHDSLYTSPESRTILKAYHEMASQLGRELGAEIVEVELPHTKYALSAYYIIAPAEASSNLGRFDGIRFGFYEKNTNLSEQISENERLVMYRFEGFGPEVQRRILLGTFVLSSESYDSFFSAAQKTRRLICKDFDDAFRLTNVLCDSPSPGNEQGVDLIFAPTSSRLPPVVGSTDKDIVDQYSTDIFTIPASLAGLPSLTIPSPSISMTGFQLISQYGYDFLPLQVAAILHRNK